jgi:CBS domain-containing protein
MYFLSRLLYKPVRTQKGERVGRVHDLLVPAGEHPTVSSVVVKQGRRYTRLAWSHVASLDESGCVARDDARFQDNVVSEVDLSLAYDLMDKQIVDTDGRRVVRVNDLQMSAVGEQMRVVGVDVSTRGLLRRIGWERLGERVASAFKKTMPAGLIPWEYVESLDVRQIRLTVSRQKLSNLHPADLAEILTDLHGPQRETLFASLDSETAAETLQEMEEDVQVSLFSKLSDEQASSVLEEMDPDEAADLIAQMPADRVQRLLARMEAEDAADVQELLSYEPDSAGGIMTTEFIGLPNTLTAQQTIDRLRELEPDAETIYYLYVVDEAERMIGVLSLRDLIVSPPHRPVVEFMKTSCIKVAVDDSVDDVRDVITKYDLLAVPVVDASGVLRGIITVDDVMDRMVTPQWKRRFPRIL